MAINLLVTCYPSSDNIGPTLCGACHFNAADGGRQRRTAVVVTVAVPVPVAVGGYLSSLRDTWRPLRETRKICWGKKAQSGACYLSLVTCHLSLVTCH